VSGAPDNRARIEQIRERLIDALAPESLDVIDESHLHVGHAGARDGRGHFRLRLSASALDGLSKLAAHRRVYEAMGSLMQTDIHALTIELDS